MAKSRDIYKAAVREIERQLKRDDVTSAECALHISNVIAEIHCIEAGVTKNLVYLKGVA